jgi:tryptophan-rich sensory protein
MNVLAMILFPVCINIPGIIGALFTVKSIPGWYNKLRRPALNPPNWIFGPVWTVLYTMIGFSGYLIWSMEGEFSNKYSYAWTMFFTQLFFNFIWTPLFFGMHFVFLAFLDILLMDIFIYLNISAFYSIFPLAGLLLIPYAIWVAFASYLNFSFWILNRNKSIEEKLN